MPTEGEQQEKPPSVGDEEFACPTVESPINDDFSDDAEEEEMPGFFQRTKQDMRKRRTTSRRLEILSATVDCIQRMRVPKCCRSLLRTQDPSEKEPRLISGLDRVIFGTVSAAQAVLICGIKPPQYLCYMLSGTICDVIQFVIDYTIHMALNVQDPSVCWALGFGLSIIFRHTSHRYLVFGNYVGGFWNSLLRMYGGYSIIIVLSTVFNIVMTKVANVSHYVAWIITLLWTGLVNYFILKKLWSFDGKLKGSKAIPSVGPDEMQEGATEDGLVKHV